MILLLATVSTQKRGVGFELTPLFLNVLALSEIATRRDGIDTA